MKNKNVISGIFPLLLAGSLSAGSLLGMLHPEAIRPGQAGPSTQDTRKGYAILLLGTSCAGKSRISTEVIDFLSGIHHQKVTALAMDTEEDQGVSKDVRKNFPHDWDSEQIIMYQRITEQTAQEKIVICDLMLFKNQG